MTNEELKKEYGRLKIELRQKVDYIHELWDTKEEYKKRAIIAEARVEELKEQNDMLRKEMNITLISGKKELPREEEVIADIRKAMEYLQYQLEKLEGKQHGNQNKV